MQASVHRYIVKIWELGKVKVSDIIITKLRINCVYV